MLPRSILVVRITCCIAKELNLTVDQVTPNRASLVQPHSPVWAGLGLGYRSAYYGYHQRGEVMHARYPDQVGGHNIDIQS